MSALAHALEVARAPRTVPAPPVAAAIVRGGSVVGVGRAAGDASALARALGDALAAGAELRGARAVVTSLGLEDTAAVARAGRALADAGVMEVDVGAADARSPSSVDALRAAGLTVAPSAADADAAAACARLLADHLEGEALGRPLVTAKAALSLDGRMAADDGRSAWLTGPRARAHGHALRSRSDAVMIGVGTALADDPHLTVRDAEGRSPLRVVLDRTLRLPASAALVRTAREVPTLVFHGEGASPSAHAALHEAGVALHTVGSSDGAGLDLATCLATLRRFGVVRLLVEGGATLLRALFARRYVDAVSFAYAPLVLGGEGRHTFGGLGFGGTMADGARLDGVSIHTFGADVVVEGALPSPWRSSCSPA